MEPASTSPKIPTALLVHPDDPRRWWRFRDPVSILRADALADVPTLLEELEAATSRGLHAVGFLSYEAAPAFDAALSVHQPGAAMRGDAPAELDFGPVPLAWWALFRDPAEAKHPVAGDGERALAAQTAWRACLTPAEHRAAIERIHDAIAAGDTYQANFTFPLEARIVPELAAYPEALFAALVAAQRGTRDAVFLDTGRFAICSASPELFLARDGERLVSRPMKGTALRGRFPAEDARAREALLASEKDRAENVMIVDMVRNDLGRVARTGSVRVEELFGVETYPTVHQLVSTVAAESSAPLVEVLAALFPAASITGAPKIRTSRLIHELEVGPRGVYTGTVGWIGPGRRARLNVAIRTVTIDRGKFEGRSLRPVARYGTGGGIVWDSEADAELAECRAKTSVLTSSPPPFELLETLLWRRRSGFFLLERHLERLAASAGYFAFEYDEAAVLAALGETVKGLDGNAEPCLRARVRLVLSEDGLARATATPFPCAGRETWRVCLDDRPVDRDDPFLFHKTTHRTVYDEAMARHPKVDEVILWNARGELTESTRANLVLKIDGEWLTPPVESGLLAGTYRAELLERGRLREVVLPVERLGEAEEIFLINGLRGWVRAKRLVAESDRISSSISLT